MHELLGVQVGHAIGDLRSHLDHLPQRRGWPARVILQGKITVMPWFGGDVTLKVIQFPATSSGTFQPGFGCFQLLWAIYARPSPPSQPGLSSQYQIKSTLFQLKAIKSHKSLYPNIFYIASRCPRCVLQIISMEV